MVNDTIDLDRAGIIFDIQRFSVHDGPGIRTLIFIKGCPLSCLWCSNPESQKKEPQIMFIRNNCIGCRKCLSVCAVNAINFNSSFRIDYDKCIQCGKCIDVCYSNALNMAGYKRTVKEVLDEVKKDNIYYRRSGGGITLSGGEPLAQPEFTKELLKACKASGLHTAIETTAFAFEDALKKVLPWLDLVLLDIKTMDYNKHIKYIGQSNEKILQNAKLIAQFGIPIIVRIPIITGFNDDISSIKDITNFAISLKSVKEIHIMPYHRLGQNKYEYLGYEYKLKELESPTKDKLILLKETVEECGLICKIGGNS